MRDNAIPRWDQSATNPCCVVGYAAGRRPVGVGICLLSLLVGGEWRSNGKRDLLSRRQRRHGSDMRTMSAGCRIEGYIPESRPETTAQDQEESN